MDDKTFDLVIIGAAAAGSAAAIYAARRHLNFVVVTKDIGGEVALSGEVENWPGTIHTNGYDLSQDFYKHIKHYEVPVDEGFGVEEIIQEKNLHIIKAKNSKGETKEYKTKSVIITSGIHPRMLNIPGEKELKGKGVTYCTVCDGPLFKNKTTVTIGAGNSALESALMMSDIAQKVYLITKYPNTKEKNHGFPPGENIIIKKLLEKDNVEIIYNALTQEILGENKVTKVTYKDTESNENKSIETDAVMVHIGMVPNSDFVNCAEKNQAGEIIVDTMCKTNCPGIFAAGDVTNVPFKQIVIAAGQGATAGLSAIDYINKWTTDA